MKYDYQYSNEKTVVKFNFDGEFSLLGVNVSDELLIKMQNCEEIEGFKSEDI